MMCVQGRRRSTLNSLRWGEGKEAVLLHHRLSAACAATGACRRSSIDAKPAMLGFNTNTAAISTPRLRLIAHVTGA
ncbi:hypothetical protein OPV22_024264 [Ensete ventricosum]|uniref:Uncharacterized protein n=1 Tax=Ensete ventricosum TaxID=4639 RepID=A0AAV8QNN5_ENSVE|nr:hypothetical protein OPV22_024264 [Ensete ventricosum]